MTGGLSAARASFHSAAEACGSTVEEHRITAGRSEGRSEVDGKRRFSDAPLLVDDRNNLHSSPPSPPIHLLDSLLFRNLFC
jgi:hypothetical protein